MGNSVCTGFNPSAFTRGTTWQTMSALNELIHEFYADPANERGFQIWKERRERENAENQSAGQRTESAVAPA